MICSLCRLTCANERTLRAHQRAEHTKPCPLGCGAMCIPTRNTLLNWRAHLRELHGVEVGHGDPVEAALARIYTARTDKGREAGRKALIRAVHLRVLRRRAAA